MLSCMTPTFLEDAQRVAVLGTPGGSRIISMVLLATLDFADNKPPASWVNLPRIHHQFMPDVIEYEQGALTAAELTGLAAKGHKTQATHNPYGDMQAAVWYKTTHALDAASDKRGEGRAAVK
jgi:gamma-glutamyltranspeptidase/glutathione hydrolase